MSLILALGVFGKVEPMLCSANSNFTANFAAILRSKSDGHQMCRQQHASITVVYRATVLIILAPLLDPV